MKILWVGLLCMVVVGCANTSGLMIETGKDYKGEIDIGWGPMSIIHANSAGSKRICIPGKDALKNNPDNNWCRKWMNGDSVPSKSE